MTALGSVALAAGLAAWPALGIAERIGVVWGAAAGGGLAVALVAGGLLARVPAFVTAGLVLLGAEYGAVLAIESEPLDRGAPVVAAALFLAAELAWWSLELRTRIAAEAGSYLRRLAFVLGLTIAALALGAGVLALVDAVRVGGLAVELAGAAAAVAAVALALTAARGERS
jgi:hypothetical protein